MMLKRWVPIVAVAVLLIFAATGQADAQTDKQEYEGRILTDKFTVRLGGLAQNFETNIAASGSGILGVSVRLEDVLGYEEDLETGMLSGFWRLGTTNKHAVAFTLAAFDRSTSGTIMGTLPFFDEEFVGDFSSTFDVRVFNFNYRYSFVNTGKTEAGFTAGLSTYDFDFLIDGTIQIGGDPMMLETTRETTDFLAPLPTVGFFVNYAIKPQLIVGFYFNGLDIDIDDVSGRVLNTGVEFSWYFSKYVGIGVALTTSDLAYDNKETGNQSRIEYQQTGTSLFLTFGF